MGGAYPQRHAKTEVDEINLRDVVLVTDYLEYLDEDWEEQDDDTGEAQRELF